MKRNIFIIALVVLICIMIYMFLPKDRLNCSNDSEQQLEENNLENIKNGKYEMITGEIEKIINKNNKRSLLIKDEKGTEYIFHINEQTVVLAFEKLKEGQRVDIFYNGILTRSIPPQGNAIIVDGLKL